MTIQDAAAAAARVLEHAGFSAADARADVSVLARHLLGWTLTEWATKTGDVATAEFGDRLTAAARRRATHEPVAYITGEREFYGRTFRVTPDVLIPRPETEAIIDAVLQPSAPSVTSVTSVTSVLDVGTGSGCVAITLALEWPGARVVATDISERALVVARGNAHALGAHLEFLHAPFWPETLGPFDLIVSNPPYVPERDRNSLAPDVRDFEPASALFAGPDGLDVISELIARAATALAPGGRLVFEIGAGQADAVAALVPSAGLKLDDIQADLQGIPRVVSARRG